MYRLIAVILMETMREIQEKINALEAQKFMLLEELVDEIILKLITEIKNLQTGCGAGYVAEDYYAETRYYSEIDGIKNLRLGKNMEGQNVLEVKVYSRKGKDLVEHISEYFSIPEIDKIIISYSKHYSEEINY